MIRREVIEQLGYRDAGWPEDYDLVLRLLEAGHRIGAVERRLLAWRHGPDRLSQNDPRYSIERFTECKAAFIARGPLNNTDRYVLWGYGGTGRTLCRALAAHGKRPSHIVELHPGRLGNVIQGAPVISPDRLAAPECRARLIIVSVAGDTARAEIRAALGALGISNYVCAA